MTYLIVLTMEDSCRGFVFRELVYGERLIMGLLRIHGGHSEDQHDRETSPSLRPMACRSDDVLRPSGGMRCDLGVGENDI